MTSPHPELEVLAELAERADLPEQSARADAPPTPATTADQAQAQAHLAQCARCAAEVDALRGVRARLRSLPAPTMPDSVAARLEAAVRAEAGPPVVILPKRSARHRGGLGGGQGAGRRVGRGGLPMPAAAAVVVLVVAALGVGVGVLATRGHNATTSESAPRPNDLPASAAVNAAAGAATAVTRIASGTRYETATVRDQVAALVVAHVPDAAQRYTGLRALTHTSAQSAPAAAPSNAAAASAPAATSAASAPLAGGETFGPPAIAPTAPSGPLADATALNKCVMSLVHQAETPEFVDYALFNGKPATIIVLPDPDDSSRLDVYVEANTDDCVAGGLSYWGSLTAGS